MKLLLYYLAAGCLGNFLFSVDVPVLAQSLQLVGSVSGPASDPRGPIDAVATAGWLYTANFGNSSISIYNVSQPANPQRVSVLASPGRPRNIVVNGNRAYVACYGIGGPITSNIQAVDISSAAAPVEVKRITLSGGPLGIATNGPLVCAVSPTGTLYVFDTALTQLSSVSLPTPGLVTLNGNYAYVLANTNPTPPAPAQLRTYDLSVPTAPVLVSTLTLGATTSTGEVYKMILYNGALFVPSTREVFSVGNPSAPVRQTALPYSLAAAVGFAAYGIGRDNTTSPAKSTVLAYDVHTPFAPTLAATVVSSTTNDINVVTGFGDYVYALTTSGDYVQVYKYTAGPLGIQAAALPVASSIYPNPSTAGEVTFTLPAATSAPTVASVYDRQGRLVREQVVPGGSTQVQLDLSSAAPGLYLVRCGTIAQKLVRQ